MIKTIEVPVENTQTLQVIGEGLRYAVFVKEWGSTLDRREAIIPRKVKIYAITAYESEARQLLRAEKSDLRVFGYIDLLTGKYNYA